MPSLAQARSSHASTNATAVVDIDPCGDAARGQGRAQRGREPHGVLGEPEPVPDQQPGVIVEEREQVGLASGDDRAVQGVL